MAPFLHLILILSILCFNTLAETVPTAKAKSANLPGGPQGFCVPSGDSFTASNGNDYDRLAMVAFSY
jgi:hypothetical protein